MTYCIIKEAHKRDLHHDANHVYGPL